ncbi:hypothetical protein LOD99_3435 [Oopsacas minuta]|uniref:Uncharacterized protein n=1 Tax=Oopsacas minuta TaxID=111878 RepID=A0AAV7JYE4_9METZ|nr:hypothetical protein LOD99_3435 [Oopsacas minuta]
MSGNLNREDLEFFTKELNYEKFDKTILITGEHNAAQDVLTSFLDTNAKFHENELVSLHELNMDKQNIGIEKILREERIEYENPIPNAQDVPNIRDCIEKLIIDWDFDDKKDLDDKLLKYMLDNELGSQLFKNSIQIEDYPIESHHYLEEALFYCQKAREYISRVDKAQSQVNYYHGKIEEWKNKYSQIADRYKTVADSFLKILTDYGDIVQYCLDEACHWKRLAEIQKRNSMDKIRIGDPSKMNWCSTHIDNQAVKYVYMPADKRVIDEATIDVELVKCGIMQRDGIDASMLAVKSIESFKDEEMKSIFDRLNTYGGDFKDRGMLMITDEEVDFDPVKDREKIEDILTDKDCPEFFREVAKDLGERIIPVHKVVVENVFPAINLNKSVKRVNFGRQNAIQNQKKLIDGIKRIDEVTEGKKHISEIAEIGSKTFIKLQELKVDGIDELEGLKRIEEAIIHEVFETRDVMMQERVDKERIIEEKRVEERIFEKEREDRLKIDVEREKEEDRLQRLLEEMKLARQIRKQEKHKEQLRRREKQRREEDAKIEERLEWKIIEIRFQIDEKIDANDTIDQITIEWLNSNKMHEDYKQVEEMYAELTDDKEFLKKLYDQVELAYSDRVELKLKEVRTRWDILLLKYGDMGKLMLMGFFFT